MSASAVIAAMGSTQPVFTPAPRTYAGNMCGVRVPGLPPVPGGANDPDLVLSWFIDRYSQSDRRRTYSVWADKGDDDVLISWPDSRSFGQTPQQFGATCRELIAHGYGFRPNVFLCSKDHDPRDVAGILANIAPVLPFLVGVVPRVCIGWELSLWLSPTQVQELIDALAPMFNAYGCKVYVHFEQGYGSFQQPGQPFAAFWNLNVGKLTGLFHQKIIAQTPHEYRYDSGGLTDILDRFAGQAGCSPDSGFGHPFDLIALEISSVTQFDGTTTEAQGDSLGRWAIGTPPSIGPFGPVPVQGSGNGQ